MKLFSEYVDGNYKRIHAFELDEDNFHILQRNTVEMHDVVLHHAGVGEENERITYFVGSGDNEPTDGISLMKQGGRKAQRENRAAGRCAEGRAGYVYQDGH